MFPFDHPMLTEYIDLRDKGLDFRTEEQIEMRRQLDENSLSPFKAAKYIDRIHAYILVYDCSNRHSFDTMMVMYDQLNKYIQHYSIRGPRKSAFNYVPPKIMIMGNKRDKSKNKKAGFI